VGLCVCVCARARTCVCVCVFVVVGYMRDSAPLKSLLWVSSDGLLCRSL